MKAKIIITEDWYCYYWNIDLRGAVITAIRDYKTEKGARLAARGMATALGLEVKSESKVCK